MVVSVVLCKAPHALRSPAVLPLSPCSTAASSRTCLPASSFLSLAPTHGALRFGFYIMLGSGSVFIYLFIYFTLLLGLSFSLCLEVQVQMPSPPGRCVLIQKITGSGLAGV